MNTQRIRGLLVVLGVAATLAVAGCDDEAPQPPGVNDLDTPTLKHTAPELP